MSSLPPLPLPSSTLSLTPHPQLSTRYYKHTTLDVVILQVIVCLSLPSGLAEQLVQEVKRLQQELSLTKTKLATAEELIHKMPSEGTPPPALPPNIPSSLYFPIPHSMYA